MKKRIFGPAFLFTLFLIFPALACDCQREDFTYNASESNIQSAVLIFKGEVMKVQPSNLQGRVQKIAASAQTPDQSPYFSNVTLEMLDLYKGRDVKRVSAYFDTVTSCGQKVEQGDTGLFLLNENNGLLISADRCSKYIAPDHMKKLKDGGYIKIAQVETKKPVATPTPVPTPPQPDEPSVPDILPEDIEAVPFTEEFQSEKALKEWAATSTLGGGFTERRTLFDKKVTLVLRSYTQGVPSFDVGAYLRKGEKWVLIKSNPSVLGDQPMIQVVDDNLIVMTQKDQQEVLSISLPDLQ